MSLDEKGSREQPAAREDTSRLRPLTVLLGLVGLAVWVLTVPSAGPPSGPEVVTAVALVAAFVVAEAAQLHLELRRQTFSVSLSEVPLVVGLFLVSAWLLLATRLTGYVCVALARRMNPDKAAFNVALFGAEVAVAVAVFHAVAAPAPMSPRAWGAAYLAALAALMLGNLALFVAIRLVQPPFTLRQLRAVSLPSLVTGAFSATLGLLVVVLLRSSGWTAVGLIMVAAVLVFAYRRYGQLVIEHKDLGELYELTREVSTSLRGTTLDEAVLERVRKLMRAEVAQLWLAEGGQLVAKPADTGLTDARAPADVLRRQVLSGASILAGPRTRDVALREALVQRGSRELVAVPLRVGGAVVGSLEVVDRQGERSSFGPADRSLLETLAVHTGVALENVRLVGRLRHEADHDPLTGLPNRKAFVERLDGALRDGSAGQRLAILVLDLQSFKDVNDTLGRAAGDRLLVEIASRIGGDADDPRRVARLSSDEFGVFVPVADLESARDAAAHLQSLLAPPVLLGKVEVEVGAVVGIAVSPDHGSDALTLVQRADVAMYAAKRASRGILAYTSSMDAPSVRRFGLVSELRRALDADDLLVWYQPQVRLDRSELVGLEALVRWQHPEHGLIPPDEFIPVAEHTGLIGPLTSFVLNRALSDLREWRKLGHEFGMSVNLSVRSLLDPGFAEEIRSALAAAGIPPHLLTLEITESGVMSDPARAIPVLDRLRDMGVRLSVDDFGIGHSSLTYLRRLPVAEVKIDRSFVSSMVHNPGDLAIVRAVIDLSEPLGLSVVAEGVESEETRRELVRLGCGIIQGYLLSRPLPKADMDGWLARRTVAVSPDPPGPPRWLRVVSG